MSRKSDPLAQLFAQYVRKQAAAREQGLGFADVSGEVVPHEAVPVQPVDPALAWQDAVAAANGVAHSLSVPAEWPQLVAAQEPATAVAFALGNFPQLVRNLQPLLADGARVPAVANRPAALPGLLEWAADARDYPQTLMAAGILRLAQHFDQAAELLRKSGEGPEERRAVRANEEAALMWHRGQYDEAATKWQAQEATTPVLFNRGMAALFLGRRSDAQAALTEAVAHLPETSAWHHLGRLYLALPLPA